METRALLEDAWKLIEANRLTEARDFLKYVVKSRTDDPEAWMMLGTVHLEQGTFDDGIRCLEQSIAIDATSADPHLHIGNARLSQGRIEEAREAFRRAVECDPDFFEAWIALGTLALQSGDCKAAEAAARRAIGLAPDEPEGYACLARTQRALGHLYDATETCRLGLRGVTNPVELWLLLGALHEERHESANAETCYRELIALAPQSAAGHRQLGTILLSRGKLTDAKHELETALHYDPRSCRTLTLLGNASLGLSHYREAENFYRKSLAISPDQPVVYANLGKSLQSQGKLREALESYRSAVTIAPGRADLHTHLAMGLDGAGDFDEALVECDMALEIDPALDDAIIGKAVILERQGRYSESLETITALLDNGIDKVSAVIAFATLAPRFQRTEKAIDMLISLLGRNELTPIDVQQIHHRLGVLYDLTRRHDEAMRHFRASNELKGNCFDIPAHERFIDKMIAQFSRNYLTNSPKPHNACDLPLFIVGMPRSGTSLVEQILASHSKITGGGELDSIRKMTESLSIILDSVLCYPDCLSIATPAALNDLSGQYLRNLRAIDEKAHRITDKMPHNFLHLGFIQLLFPQARVIHVIRDPLDTCLSCYFQEFSSTHSYATNLEALGAYYNAYCKIMQHWRGILDIPMLEVHYEQLVANPEIEIRKMISFCGLDWEEGCLRFHESGRYVATPSYDQVRQPIYTGSVKRWKDYEHHLGPLKATLTNYI